MKTRATLTSKGQTTIPKTVRRLLGLRAGDTLEFEVQRGRVEVRPAKPKGISAGILKNELPQGWRPPTVAEMDAGMLRYFAHKHGRA